MADSRIYSLLIIDDDPLVRDSLTAALKLKGFVTYATDNQEGAIRIVKAHRPSLVCVDMRMPRLNGVEVIKMLYEIDDTISVVVISAYMDNPEYNYAEEVKKLNVRVVRKMSGYFEELENVICEELSLKQKDIEGLISREKLDLKKRFLFVDDDPLIIDFLREVATDEGIKADFALSAKEALEKAASSDFDILCTDLLLGGDKDGDELIKEMKSSSEFSSIKVYVGMTGANEQRDRFFHVGVDSYASKPFFSPDEFFKLLKNWAELAN